MLRGLKPGKLLLVAGIAIILTVGFFLFQQLRNRTNATVTDVTIQQDAVANVNDGKTQIVVADNPVLINANNGTRKILKSELQVAPAPTPVPTAVPTQPPAQEESVQPQAQPTPVPQPAPTAVPPTADPNNCNTGRSHTVQKGENVFRIARAFGVSQQAVRDINGLGAYYTIYPGQVLCLPGEASGSPSESTLGQPGATVFTNGVCAAGWHEHTVFNGTTLFGLALEHGTTVENLRAVNGLTNDLIYPGQILCMPN